MPYLLLAVLILVFIFGPHVWVKYALNKYNKQDERLGGTGRELARYLLDAADLQNVQLEETKDKNYYDPAAQRIGLQSEYMNGKSVTALAVAAHECAHAVQHKNDERLFKLRIRYIQKTDRFDKIAYLILLTSPVIFAFVHIPALFIAQFWLGLVFMGVKLGLHIFTLPVEWDASFNKALPVLENANVLNNMQLEQAKIVLKACALTYVSAALMGLLNFLRWIR